MNQKYVISLFILFGLFMITAKAARTNEVMPQYAPRGLYAVNEFLK